MNKLVEEVEYYLNNMDDELCDFDTARDSLEMLAQDLLTVSRENITNVMNESVSDDADSLLSDMNSAATSFQEYLREVAKRVLKVEKLNRTSDKKELTALKKQYDYLWDEYVADEVKYLKRKKK